MSWNGYPWYVWNKIIKSLENKKNTKNTDTLEQENAVKIFCRVPCARVQGGKLIKNLVKKLKRHIDEPFKLRNIYCMKKLSQYCNTKDKVPEYLKFHIVYEFCCPACNSKYIGKTDRNFGTLVQEHSGSDKTSLVSNHLLEGEHFNYVVNLHSLLILIECNFSHLLRWPRLLLCFRKKCDEVELSFHSYKNWYFVIYMKNFQNSWPHINSQN